MKITLAYPYTDAARVEHEPDETIEVPDREGKRLIRDGLARPAVVEESDPGQPAKKLFDPSAVSTNRVLSYLAKADDAERERVLAAERDGKARHDVLAFTPPEQ